MVQLSRLLWLAGLTVALGNLGAAQERRDGEEREEPGLQEARSEWFKRLRPGNPVNNARTRLKSVRQVKRRFASAPSAASSQSSASTGSWAPIGPQPGSYSSLAQVSGRITALAVQPGNANVVYAGTGDGGVWKTTDGGLNWSPLTDLQPSLSIGDLALDPQNPSTIIAATGDPKSATGPFLGVGLLKSTDGGATWINIPGPFVGSLIPSIAIHPSNSQIWLVSRDNPAGRGIFRTTDGGTTWTQTLSAYSRRVLFDPQNGNVAYATTLEGQVFRSTDAGATWGPATGSGATSLPAGGGYTELGIDPSNTSTLYASVGVGGGINNLLGVFKSTDSGAHWTAIANAPDYCSPQCSYNNVIRVFPGNSQILFLGGILLYYSLDGGNTWTNVPDTVIHDDQQALAFSSDGLKLYEGNDGGVWSNNLSASVPGPWTNLNATLAITQFYPGLSIHPTNINFMLGGTQDNGTQAYSGNSQWNYAACGDGGRTAIDSVNPTTVYITCAGLDIAILKSTSSGSAGSLVQIDGPIPREQHAFVPAFAIDPSNSNVLYYGTTRVFQSKDGGSTWNPISPSFTAQVPIASIAVAPSDSDTVYAATLGGQVEVTTNALSTPTWTDISAGLPGLPISAIAVQTQNSQYVCIGTSAYTMGAGEHVYLSLNGGANWSDQTGTLPDVPVNDLVIDAEVPNTFYAATDAGVFETSDQGVHWVAAGIGLPQAAVLGLQLQQATRILVAATFGRGVWELGVPTANATLSPTSMQFSLSGGTGMVTVMTDPSVQWTAISNNPWITVTGGASGTGSGTVTYSAASAGSGGRRIGTITIAGLLFPITEAVPPASLTISSTHTGNFLVGQSNASYTINVSNSSNGLATSGTVTVTDTLPPGLTLVSMTGSGWACSGNICTRSDALDGGSNYPPITVIVGVGGNAVPSVTNQATVSGGGVAQPITSTDVTTVLPIRVSKVGVWRNAFWVIDANNNHQYDGPPSDEFIQWGGGGVIPVRGDWNGDGKTKVGVYYQGFWYLDYNGDGIFEPGVDKVYYFGDAGSTPVVGDWSGSGTTKIGIYKAGVFILDVNGNGVYDPGIDSYFGWGPTSGAQPVLGDWNGDGRTKAGIFQSGFWAIDYNGDGIFEPGTDKFLQWGQANGVPVVGDWNGSGTTKIGSWSLGSYGPNVGQFALDVNGDYAYEPGTDAAFAWGDGSSIPVVGDWNGDGRTKVGVFSNGFWVLDTNGDFQFESGTDAAFQFGGCGAAAYPCGQMPVPGKW